VKNGSRVACLLLQPAVINEIATMTALAIPVRPRRFTFQLSADPMSAKGKQTPLLAWASVLSPDA